MSERGCGTRKEGGLYLTVPLSPNGKPAEYFLVDPCSEWLGGTLRAPELFHVPNAKPEDDVAHVIMGVGASFYPFVPDFVEEVRVMGLSKRVPLSVDVSQLVPGKSRLLLVHPKAIPEFNYIIPRAFGAKTIKGDTKGAACPKGIPESHLCIGDLWPLSVTWPAAQSSDKHAIKTPDFRTMQTVTTPSTRYNVILEGEIEILADKNPISLDYQAGIFMKFPFFQFQFVSKKGMVPRKVAEKFQQSSFELEVVPE